MSLTLTISHNIFLNKEQRYSLFNGDTINVIGVSVPVWYYQGRTSEPANEVFCKYKLMPNDYEIYIKHNDIGYDFKLPKHDYNPIDNKANPLSLKNILDHKDGGMEWLAFRQFGKAKKNKRNVNIIHFVEIKSFAELCLS